jgi:hypothetical protein
MESIKLNIKSCALCPFRMQVGILEVKERCMLLADQEKELEYSISPLGRDKSCPLPKKIKFEI